MEPVRFEGRKHSCREVPKHVLARKNLYQYFPALQSGKVMLSIAREGGRWFIKMTAQDNVGVILKFEVEFCPFCGTKLG